MLKYLLPEQLKTHLSLGKTVEQWLGHKQEVDYVILKYVNLVREKDGNYTVMHFEVIDEGDEGFLDIDDFSYVDPDEPAVVNSFDSVQEVLDFAQNTYGASLDRYLASGMIQDEYARYLQSRN
jgi:hypothetical protein